MDCDPKLDPGPMPDVPLVMITKASGEQLLSMLRGTDQTLGANVANVCTPDVTVAPHADRGASLPADVSLWAPDLPPIDLSSLVMWVIATGTVYVAGLLAQHDWRVERASEAGEAKARLHAPPPAHQMTASCRPSAV